MRASGRGHGIGSALVVLVLLGLAKMAAAQGAGVPAEPAPGASASSAPGTAPAGGHPSPVESAQQALDQLRSAGKDVASLQAELDALRPDWSRIQELQRDLMNRVEAFRPRMEALITKIHSAMGAASGGRSSGPDEGPIVGMQRGLDHLKSRGKDVASLQAELTALEPTWDKIQGFQKELASLAGEAQRAAKQQEIAKLAGTLQPRVQELARKIQTMAKDLEGSGGTGVHADPAER